MLEHLVDIKAVSAKRVYHVNNASVFIVSDGGYVPAIAYYSNRASIAEMVAEVPVTIACIVNPGDCIKQAGSSY